MEINQKSEQGTLVVNVKGRVDTTTAPQLEKSVKECLEGVKRLELDCKEMEYISSAGLRVLLSFHKAMSRQGEFVVKNVSEIIMEILDVTGFTDILTIE